MAEKNDEIKERKEALIFYGRSLICVFRQEKWTEEKSSISSLLDESTTNELLILVYQYTHTRLKKIKKKVKIKKNVIQIVCMHARGYTKVSCNEVEFVILGDKKSSTYNEFL